MKKILVAIALVIVLTTLAVLPTFAADNAKVSVEELIKWNVLGENDIHYVGAPTTTPPTQDGSIKKGEYSYSFRATDPIFQCTTDHNYNKIAYNPLTDFSSNYVEYYISYDADYIYFGIYDDQSVQCGSSVNFFFKYGIDPEDVSYANLIGPSTQIVNRGKDFADFYKGSSGDARYVSVNGKSIKYIEVADGMSGDDGYGAYDSVYEFKINRADAKEIYNGLKGTGFVDNPKVFYATTYCLQYGKDQVKSCYRWCGRELTNVEKLNLGASIDFIPLIFVLAEEGSDFLGNGALEVPTKPAETEAPTTEAPTTAPETEAPTTEAPTTAPETEAPTTAPVTEAPTTEAPDEGGCGSSVAAMGIALVAVLGTCAVVVSKKED
ncbi:MAG: hypothetical protein IKB02_02745 [Clostridia bacterium]|nr:hypothetical protein [Clostridia bacterium]